MGYLYRPKKKDQATGKWIKIEDGPWWMKYYDNGKAVRESTHQYDKREAQKVLTRAEHKVIEKQRGRGYFYRIRNYRGTSPRQDPNQNDDGRGALPGPNCWSED